MFKAQQFVIFIPLFCHMARRNHHKHNNLKFSCLLRSLNLQVELAQDYCYFHRRFSSQDTRSIVLHRCRSEDMSIQHIHSNDRRTSEKNSRPLSCTCLCCKEEKDYLKILLGDIFKVSFTISSLTYNWTCMLRYNLQSLCLSLERFEDFDLTILMRKKRK